MAQVGKASSSRDKEGRSLVWVDYRVPDVLYMSMEGAALTEENHKPTSLCNHPVGLIFLIWVKSQGRPQGISGHFWVIQSPPVGN